MKIGILTFQFAHNYGALLQTYALQQYLRNEGFEVEVLNFISNQVKHEYSMNPFVYSKSPKTIASLVIRNMFRYKQNKLFRDFQDNMLNLGKPIFTSEQLNIKECSFDYVSVGSDQVWNVALTGNISDYFLSFSSKTTKKVSFAGSFGTVSVNQFQISQMKKWFPQYKAISVREEAARDIIDKYTGLNSQIVCDPVFLHNADVWEKFGRKPDSVSVNSNYVLYYALKYDNELINLANTCATKNNYMIYSIHPTAIIQKTNGKQLFDVGPQEFIWLIKNAAYIVTNSFHATAFSVIFRKKLIYKSIDGLGSRVHSLFHQLNIECKQDRFIDFSKIDDFNVKRLQASGIDYIKSIFV